LEIRVWNKYGNDEIYGMILDGTKARAIAKYRTAGTTQLVFLGQVAMIRKKT